MAVLNSQTITVSINRPPNEVYEFVRIPANFTKFTPWAKSARQENGQWILETPDGPMQMTFGPRNDLGVLDHVVKLGDREVHNPMRVIPNGDGSEVIFTLFQTTTAEAFRNDAKAVEKDLQALKKLLEK